MSHHFPVDSDSAPDPQTSLPLDLPYDCDLANQVLVCVWLCLPTWCCPSLGAIFLAGLRACSGACQRLGCGQSYHHPWPSTSLLAGGCGQGWLGKKGAPLPGQPWVPSLCTAVHYYAPWHREPNCDHCWSLHSNRQLLQYGFLTVCQGKQITYSTDQHAIYFPAFFHPAHSHTSTLFSRTAPLQEQCPHGITELASWLCTNTVMYLGYIIPNTIFPFLCFFKPNAIMQWGITLIFYHVISLKLHLNGIAQIENKNLARIWDLFLRLS